MNKSNNKRNYYVDFLKLIFSIIIVYYHSWMFNGNYSYFERGFYAVDFYFIITGFLFIKSLEKIYNKKTKEPIGLLNIKFIFKKIKDILPSIIFVFIIGYFLVFRRSSFDYNVIFSNNIITEFLSLGFLGNGMAINSACWYVSVMVVVLFILFPIVYKYKKNFNYLISPLIIFFSIGICNYFNIYINSPLERGYIFINGFYKGLIFINLGVISYELCCYLKNIDLTKKIRIIGTVFETLIYIFLIINMHYSVAGSYVSAILFTFNIALTFSNISYTADLFNSERYQKMGKFGFCLYLSNIPVRTFIMAKFAYSYGRMLLVYWILVLIISSLSYFFSQFVIKKISKKHL